MDETLHSEPSDFLSLIEPQKQIISYINNNDWVQDFERDKLKTVFVAQLECAERFTKFQLHHKIKDEDQQQKLFGFINMNIKKIRNLNHSLQSTISNSNSNSDMRTSSNTSQRSCITQDKIQHQIFRLYKDTQYSTQILQQMYVGLPDIIRLIDVIGVQQDPSKKHTLCTLMKMFRFELNCLKTEILQHQYEVQPHIHAKVQEIEEDQVMFWLSRAIEHETKLKSYMARFGRILDKMLDEEFSLRSLEHVYIVLDDHSDAGSKETQQNSFTDRKRSIHSLSDNITPRKFEIQIKYNSKNNSAEFEMKQSSLLFENQRDMEFSFYDDKRVPMKDLDQEQASVAKEACFNFQCNIF